MKKLLTFFLTALLAFGVGWATQVTMTMSDYYSTSSSTNAGTITEGDVTIAFAKGNGSNDPMYYYSGAAIRFYASNTMTISVNNGTISKVEVTFNTLNYANYATSWAVNTGSWSVSNTSAIGTWTGSASSMTFTNGSNQVRFNTITIVYSSGSTPTPTCATPSFNPVEGTYTSAQNVTISCGTSGATIYYTTDGSDPTTNSSVYSAAIPVSTTTTIKAMATATGYNNSAVASATYTINTGGGSNAYELVTDVSTLSDGDNIIFVNSGSAGSAYAMSTTQNNNNRGTTSVTVANNNGVMTVEPSSDTEVFTLESGWYFRTHDNKYIYAASSSSNYLRTEDNKDSNNNAKANISVSNAGVATIVFQGTNTRNVMQFNGGIVACYGSANQSPVYIYRRAGTPTVATPTFSPAAGTYYSAQSVTISCATEGATIYYTTDGSDPTTSSTPYTGAITVSSTTTIKAIAVLTNYNDSEVATATYTINLNPTITASPATVNINDDNTSGARTGTFTVTGANLGTANVGVTRTNDKFTPYLETTPGSGSATNASTYWYFTPANSLEGTVTMTYNGHALSATTAVNLSNGNNASASVNVNYLYTGPIYIMGNVNSTGWAPNNGVLMDRDASTGNYSKTLTLLDSGNGYAYISFTKALASGSGNEYWNSIAGSRFGPDSNGDWTFYEQYANQPCALDTTGGYYSIKLPAGEWVVSINPSTNTFTLVPHVAAPVFDPAGGRYETAQTVEITCTNSDAHIYYTTDGTTPSAQNGTLYTGPITVSDESTTIKAIAIYGDYSSEVTTETYTIKPIGADDFILVESDDEITAGDEYVLVYTSGTLVHHAMSTSYTNYYYGETTSDFTLADGVVTLDDPTTVNVLTLETAGNGNFYIKDENGYYLYYQGSSNNVYRATSNDQTDGYKWQMTINGTGDVVINNVGSSDRYLQSNPSSTRYACYKTTSNLYNPKLYKKGTSSVPAPQITPAGGATNKRFESFDVTITAADQNYTIYYTTDGSTPTVNSTEYTGPFELPYGSAPTTVKAIAVDGDGNVSRPTTVIYYWDRATVSISPASQRVTGDVNNVTITYAPSDATVTYKVNGGTEQAYSAPFTVQVNEENHTVTVVAIATKGESVATDTVTYTFKSDKVYSIEEFELLDNGEEVTFESSVTVLFDYSQDPQDATKSGQEYIWVKDRTGYTQFFLTPAIDHTNYVPKYENGDVIPPGFKVKKNYYETGGYIQGFCSGDSINTFTTSNTKALADPEQVTLSELKANAPSYNDRYLYINKVKITVEEDSRHNFAFAADENGTIVYGSNAGDGEWAVVGYNKYNSPAWKNKQGETVGVTIPEADNTYYNVTFIFQKWGSNYEIMPIEFTPWQENKVRLEDLVEIGEPNVQYTITNPLIAAKVTWDDAKGKFAIFAKDDEMYANKREPGNLKTYLIEYENGDFINTVEQEDYDQSNWIEILIPDTINTNPITTKNVDQALYNSTLGALQELYENKILAGGTISGTYVDVLNPTILMTTPPAWPTSGSTYDPNIYCTGNFLMSNIDANGAESGRTDEYGGQYFMMDAKPHEFCKVVWAYFEGSDDYFVAPARYGDDINGLDFNGGFLTNMSLCEEWGVTSQSHAQALFKASNDESYGDEEALYSFNAIVRKNQAYWQTTGGNGAPRRITPKDDGVRDGTPAYIVYPLSSGDNSEVVTSVDEVKGSKEVESIRYYNIMGQESKAPFEGVNIVVTRYTDGSTSTAKILR